MVRKEPVLTRSQANSSSPCRTKQYYQFIQKEWIEGDDGQPPPPPERKWVRNKVNTRSRAVTQALITSSTLGMETHVHQRHSVHA